MSTPQRQGFTLIELLVVISIIAILAGMLLPAINMVRRSSQEAACGSNLKGLVTSMLAYSQDYDGSYPFRPVDVSGTALPNATGAIAFNTACASMELLAAWSEGDVSKKLFKCGAQPDVKLPPSATYDPANWMDVVTTASKWAAAATDVAYMPYCYDWSVPSSAKSSRVVVSDRPTDVSTLPHSGTMSMAAYGDGHTGKLKQEGTAAAATTLASTNAAYTGKPCLNKEASDDNIYTLTDDGGNSALASKGSSTRAYVR